MKLAFKFFLTVLFSVIFVQGSQNDFSPAYVFGADSIYADSIYGNAKDSIIMISDSTDLAREKLTEGKTLYEKKCQRCHELYEPAEYTLKQWKENLEEMKVKAELKKSEYKLILNYLSANCKK